MIKVKNIYWKLKNKNIEFTKHQTGRITAFDLFVSLFLITLLAIFFIIQSAYLGTII